MGGLQPGLASRRGLFVGPEDVNNEMWSELVISVTLDRQGLRPHHWNLKLKFSVEMWLWLGVNACDVPLKLISSEWIGVRTDAGRSPLTADCHRRNARHTRGQPGHGTRERNSLTHRQHQISINKSKRFKYWGVHAIYAFDLTNILSR